MNPTGVISLPERASRLDQAVAVLVIMVLAVSILYPENFITGVLFFGSGNINPLNLMIPLVAIGLMAYLIRRRRLIRLVWADVFVVIFAVYLLIRNITGDTTLLSAKYVILGLSSFYLTALLGAGRRNLLMAILYAIVGLTLATVCYGLVEYAWQDNFIYGAYIEEIVAEPASGLHRIGSSIGHPVAYGAFLLQVLPFSVLLWFISKTRWQRMLALITLFAGVLALFLTYSKGSWIVAVLLASGAIAFGRASGRKFVRPAILIAVLLVAVTAFFWQEIREEVEGRTFSSVNVRLRAWDAAIDSIQDYPVTGVGMRLGSDQIVKYIDPVWYAEWNRPLPIDNYYLTLLAEEGMVGFLLSATAVILILRECVIAARRNGLSGAWALAALASMIGLLLNAITFDALHIWPNYVLFWVAAGIAHGMFWRAGSGGGAGESSGPLSGSGNSASK